MIQRFKLIIGFYKQFAFVSILISFLLALFNIDWFPALLAKFAFFGIVLWNIFTSDRKYQLDFYRNLRLGPNRLFFGIFILDLFFLSIIYAIVWFLK